MRIGITEAPEGGIKIVPVGNGAEAWVHLHRDIVEEYDDDNNIKLSANVQLIKLKNHKNLLQDVMEHEDYYWNKALEEERKQLIDQYSKIVQKHLDTTVQERNYDDVHTCVGTYLYSPVEKFRNEAEAVKDWVSYTWEKCYAIINDVQAGTRNVPSESELIKELPVLKW